MRYLLAFRATAKQGVHPEGTLWHVTEVCDPDTSAGSFCHGGPDSIPQPVDKYQADLWLWWCHNTHTQGFWEFVVEKVP